MNSNVSDVAETDEDILTSNSDVFRRIAPCLLLTQSGLGPSVIAVMHNERSSLDRRGRLRPSIEGDP